MKMIQTKIEIKTVILLVELAVPEHHHAMAEGVEMLTTCATVVVVTKFADQPL